MTARHVVLAAGTWGTQNLLHRMKAGGVLPGLSDRLGSLTRTNSEALLGAVARRVPADHDLTRGVAITSSFHPDPVTHVENARNGKGSNAMGLLATVLMDGEPAGSRLGRVLRVAAADPRGLLRSLGVRRWSQRTVIGLVMQTVDNSITVSVRHNRFRPGWRLVSGPGHGQANPAWIPVGHEAIRRIAGALSRRTGAAVDPAGSVAGLLGVPMTAHFIGGCVIGATAGQGVLDPYLRVHGYPGLHVMDGSAISANLGVNPALTITAQAERAVALWPNRDEPDPRPPLGAPYRPVAPVPPRHPAVPRSAAGGWRVA